jgi:hypothetical protein
MTHHDPEKSPIWDLVVSLLVLALIFGVSCSYAVHSCARKLSYARSSADTAYVLGGQGCTAWTWFGKKS